MDNQVAVTLENVSMAYKLYNSPKDRLREALHPFGKPRHKKFYALRNLNLEIKKGEVLGLVGRNGAGKSTLLKIITSVLQPTSGTVKVKGRISALLELEAGLNPRFSGIQNIRFQLTMMGFTPQEMDDKIDEVTAFADIGKFIHQPVRMYSSGMRARLGFAVATSIHPDILIVDEILGVGDMLFQRKCYARMKQLMEKSKTILFVTHNIQTVNQLCTRAVLIDGGELILDGPTRLVVGHYQRLSFTEKENVANVRNEIIQLNKNKELKKTVLVEESQKKKESKSQKTSRKIVQKGEHKESVAHAEPIVQEKVEAVERQKAFFIPDFFPKSTSIQKDYDIKVSDIGIRTPEGELVNSLVMNETYYGQFRVKFNISCQHVKFGFCIKDIKGFVISGQWAPLDKSEYLEIVNKGDEFLLKFYFECLLCPQTYYVNFQIKGTVEQEDKALYTIIDALIFKVQSFHNIKHVGIVFCNHQAEILPLTSIDDTGEMNISSDPRKNFHSLRYLHHNSKRLEHLQSLSVDFRGKTVLEIGAGIGDHTDFLLSQGCSFILATEARRENLEILRDKFKNEKKVHVEYLNMEAPIELEQKFDLGYCYGILYHLANPALALKFLSEHIEELLLLETCVSYNNEGEVNFCEENSKSFSQSVSGTGCRPGRKWIFNQLRQYFECVYLPITQPDHEEFPIDWTQEEYHVKLTRSVFIASRYKLHNPLLVEEILMHQMRYEKTLSGDTLKKMFYQSGLAYKGN